MKRYILAIILSLFCFTFGIFILKDYGINWDEPVHYLRGQAYLRFFITGKKDYRDLPRLKSHEAKFDGAILTGHTRYDDDRFFRRSIYQSDHDGPGQEYTYNYFVKNDIGHPPINDILASFSNYIFYQKLGIVGDIEAYHVFIIFISTLLVLSIALFAIKEYGLFAGFVAFLSLLSYPLFFSESHFNVKDPVEASFYSLSILSFYYAITKNNWKIMLASSFFSGLAIGTKFNVVFAFLTIFLWLIIVKWGSIKKMRWFLSKKTTIVLLLYPIIVSLILYISWPYLWQDIKNVYNIFFYYKDIGATSYQDERYFIFGIINTYAFQWVLFITPLITLFFTSLGIVRSLTLLKREEYKTSLLILLWFLIPVIRVSIQHAGIYGGVRQIMEYIPAMAILSGIGAKYTAELLNYYIVKRLRWNFITIKPLLLLQITIVLFFIPITLKLISIHPNENVYFNPIIGGLKGAKEKQFADWGVTLGSVYQQGVDWLNQNAEPNARVALIKGLLSNIPRTKLRKDINFYEGLYSGNEKKGEYLMEVTDYHWAIDIPQEKRKYIESLPRVYELRVDGVSILTIWRND